MNIAPELSDADQQAAVWMAKVQAGSCSEETKRQLEAWLSADAINRAAWAEMQRMWGGMAALGSEFSTPDDVRTTRVVSRSPRRFRVAFAVAASVCAIVWGFQAFTSRPVIKSGHRIVSLALEDTSQVTLDGDSAMSIQFSNSTRLIELDRGRAYFEVSKDASRPFIVRTGAGDLVVLGTRFEVEMKNESTRIAVDEGLVKVAPRSADASTVAAGLQMVFSEGEIGDVAPIEPTAVASWRGGILRFDQQPLKEVLGMIDRYRPGRIFILDDEVAAIPVSGALDAEAPDIALATITQALQLRMIGVPGVASILVRE